MTSVVCELGLGDYEPFDLPCSERQYGRNMLEPSAIQHG